MSDRDDDLAAAVRASYDDAVDFADSVLGPEREEAIRLYNGERFGPLAAEEGRSSVVLTEVRDTIRSMLPSLLRTLVGPKVVEFLPRNSADVPMAELCTSYVNDVVLGIDNSAPRLLHDAIHDALLLRPGGVVRWGWDTAKTVVVEHYTGISQEQRDAIVFDKTNGEVEVIEETVELCGCEGSGLGEDHVAHLDTMAKEGLPLPGVGQQVMPDAEAMMPEGIDVKIELRVRRTRTEGKARVWCIPPEEFLIDRNARDVETSPYVAHRSLRTVAELVAMGYDQDEIEEHAGSESHLGTEAEELARNPGSYGLEDGGNPDPTQRRVLYVEHFILVGNDEGIAERRRVCTIGGACEVLHDEVVDEVPFALFQSHPVPHTVVGQNIVDEVGDLQLIKSFVLRNTMDSLAQSIHPRTVVVTRDIENMDDVLSREVGQIIRVRNPSAVTQLSEPFMGAQSMPIMAYMDEVRSRRTGITATTTGLDPDALQSTSPTAIAAAQEAGLQRLELCARMLAETGLRPLMRGLLRLVVRHQDKPRWVRLKEKLIEVDPRSFDSEMDCSINIALGRDDAMQKMQMVAQAMAKIEQIIGMMGPMNPIAGVQQWRNAISDMAELGGIKNSDRYFQPITPEIMQQLQQSAGGQDKPDPNMLLAQAELAKAQAQAKKIEVDAQVAMLKHQLEVERARMEDDRIRDRDAREFELKRAEIAAKYGAQVNQAAVDAEVNRERYLNAEVTKVMQTEMQAQQPQPPQPPMGG